MVSIVGLSKMLNEKVSVFHDFAVQMLQIENALVANIQQNRRKLIQQFLLEGLNEQDQKEIFSRIYKKKMERPLTGKEAKEFFEDIKKKRGSVSNETEDQLKGYQQEIK
jgi:hypothetical protein